MQAIEKVTEISGKPAQVFGGSVIPAGGTTTMRIVGDLLETSSKLAYGLEQKVTYIRLENIDSVVVVAGRVWWLLYLGIATIWMLGLGLIGIIAFFMVKQYWIAVFSGSTAVALVYKRTENVDQFTKTLLERARQLGSQADSH